jgi:hypothetical protein
MRRSTEIDRRHAIADSHCRPNKVVVVMSRGQREDESISDIDFCSTVKLKRQRKPRHARGF